eukprot:CAMPEP_0172813324 /NCGR_PEP_ID=MMETSP1075-20121228/10587_1 /TAXON_ID=2916 /ORGANISM="Ceratium fusus, Strain PA161109" /LENGTH=306 /DNA_ID=CAMNT_0013653007 /DNA_START=129 /DNA_END=1047 /DNA_ORIENTATION=-
MGGCTKTAATSFPFANARAQEELENLEQQLFVTLSVIAEDEDGQEFRWSTRLLLQEPLLQMRAQWAEAHGVSAAAVGFEDFRDADVDIQRTPAELWNCTSTVHLRAIPLDPSFAEVGADAPVPSTEQGIKMKEPKRSRTETLEATTALAASFAREPCNGASASAVTPQQRKPTAKAKSAQQPQQFTATASGGSEDDQPIVFNAVNPKKQGSGAYERYEKYKMATTRREAMQLGASQADIKHDLKKVLQGQGSNSQVCFSTEAALPLMSLSGCVTSTPALVPLHESTEGSFAATGPPWLLCSDSEHW